VDGDLAGVLLARADPFGLAVRQSCAEDVRSSWMPVDRAVDDRLAAPELGEGVRADAELANAPSRALPGVGGPVAGGLVGGLQTGAARKKFYEARPESPPSGPFRGPPLYAPSQPQCSATQPEHYSVHT
jgi:hypothetical protein